MWPEASAATEGSHWAPVGKPIRVWAESCGAAQAGTARARAISARNAVASLEKTGRTLARPNVIRAGGQIGKPCVELYPEAGRGSTGCRGGGNLRLLAKGVDFRVHGGHREISTPQRSGEAEPQR